MRSRFADRNATGPAAFINQCYRHAQGTTIYGGTSEVHRSLIAERTLGLPERAPEGNDHDRSAAPACQRRRPDPDRTLNRPDKLNALTMQLMRTLRAKRCIASATRPSYKVLLIRSTGRISSVPGGPRAAQGRAAGGTGSAIRESTGRMPSDMHRIYDEMEPIEKPFVAAHQGPCVGGSLEMSLSCDFRLAAKSASYAFPEGKFGVLPAYQWRQPSHPDRRTALGAAAGHGQYACRRARGLDHGPGPRVFPDANLRKM